MTPTSVGLVLVEGQDADGATMDRDSFAVAKGDAPSAEQAAAAVIRTEAMAANRGLRLHSIGVTWSEDADLQASMLMESLSESGFDNVVAIRLPEATEALARGIAEVLGYATTAVCVIEPQSVISLIVNTSDGAVQTAFNHGIDSDDDLISWLSTVFTRADWAPEALVVVGSAGDFEPLMHRLEDVLSVPVFAPEEAKLALARGAALASAHGTEMPLDVFDDGFVVEARGHGGSGRHRTFGQSTQYRRTFSSVGPAAMLATGVVTFVVSASIAIGLQLSPDRPAAPSSPVTAAKVERPAAAYAAPPAVPLPAAVAPLPPVQAALPPEAPAPVYDEPPVAVVDTPAEAPAVDQAPASIPDSPPAQTVDPALAPPADSALPPVAGPPPVPPVVGGPMMLDPNTSQVPAQKPGLWTRIKERLSGGG